MIETDRQTQTDVTDQITGVYSRALTLSPPIPLKLNASPYWSNPPFFIFDIRTLRR